MKVNKVIKTLVISDFIINSAFGLSAPVFAIFILGNIQGGNAQVAGFATSFYWIVKSIFQLPIAKFLDETDGEKDDFFALLFGQLFAGFSIFLYVFATLPWHVYFIEGFLGLAMSFSVPAWYGIFTRHLDQDKMSFEWSLESVFSVGLATAGASALGGFIAENFGFNTLFVGASIWAIIGAISLIFLYPYLKKNKGEGQTFSADLEKERKTLA